LFSSLKTLIKYLQNDRKLSRRTRLTFQHLPPTIELRDCDRPGAGFRGAAAASGSHLNWPLHISINPSIAASI
jgi:hypothetical protein